jgi:integrating conjugative element protein (TIGR03749 family)
VWGLVGLCLALLSPVAVAAQPVERIPWQKTPIPIDLQVGRERLVHFPGAVTIGIPAALDGLIRIQSIAGTVYLLARQPFASTRLVVRGIDDGRVYLLDLSATLEGAAGGPLEIFAPDTKPAEQGEGAPDPSGAPAYGYVTLTRFAAQQLYAPARLLSELPGVVRVPVKREPVLLLRGDAVEAMPLIAWRAGDLYLTAVKLTNTTRRPQTLDPRNLRGQWLAATFQHNRLHAAGTEADRTVVYLISARPFAASL